MSQTSAAPEPQIRRVSTIELFFDLVFVFAVTQVTGIVAHPHGPADYARAALVFLTMMWMYEGFAWLTSNVRVQTNRDCWLLVAAMAAFMAMSMAVPTVFGVGGLVYGAGLTVAAVVHGLLFRQAPNSSAQAILRLIPYHLGMGLLVLVAGLVPMPYKWLLWGIAVAMPIVLTLQRREDGFQLSSQHFVERHGLLLIIALGESVVGVGQASRTLSPDAPLLLYTALSIYLGVCIWGSYFDEDADRARAAIERLGPDRRARVALLAFNYAHMAMIAGILIVSAGLERGVEHPFGRAPAVAAWNLAAGLALYLAGDIAYRHAVGIGPNRRRAFIAAAFLASAPLGVWLSTTVQLAACGLVGTLLWTIEEGSTPGTAHSPARTA